MKKALIAAAAACCIMLCGCNIYSPDVESLLSAPLVSDLQNHVDEALRDVVGQDIRLKYPLSGDYRSPYIFYDLDRDGEDEALVLYSLKEGAEELVYLQILDRVDDVWRAGSALPGPGSEVDFVRFAHFLDDGEPSLVIGWRTENTESNILNIYSISNYLLTETLSHHYSEIAVSDFDKNGRDELVIAETPGSLRLTLIGEDDSGALSVLDRETSQYRLTYLADPVIGTVARDLPGVVFDGMYSADCMASVAVGVQNGSLLLPQNQEGILLSQDRFSPTFRFNGARTRDVNGDGILDIPSSHLAPGYTGSLPGELTLQYFTRYSTLEEGRFVPTATTYESQNGGFCFLLPPEWVSLLEEDRLSVFYQADGKEYTFFRYTGSLGDHGEELLRLRVVSAADHLNNFDPSRYFLLAERGRFQYYARLPGISSLSPDAVRERFQLSV